MTYDQALQKAIRCLKLSQSSNQHESALAASKAQEIIDRYNLRIDDIQQGNEPKESTEEIKDFGYEDPLSEVCQVDTQWTLRLADIVSRQNSCRTFWLRIETGSSRIKIVGRPSDVQTARYVFGWLNREVRRITREGCKGHSRRWQIDFRSGVVDTIRRKLLEQRKETFASVQREAINPMALVRVQHSIAKLEARGIEVEKWAEQNIQISERQSVFRHKSNLTARQQGQIAGEQVKFTKAKGSLGSEKKFIQ